jgi:hypothetical protein
LFACLDYGPCRLFLFLSLSWLLSFLKVWLSFSTSSLTLYKGLLVLWGFFGMLCSEAQVSNILDVSCLVVYVALMLLLLISNFRG